MLKNYLKNVNAVTFEQMRIVSFLCVYLGALFFWLINGRKQPFETETSGIHDIDFMYWRNFATGAIILIGFAEILRRSLS